MLIIKTFRWARAFVICAPDVVLYHVAPAINAAATTQAYSVQDIHPVAEARHNPSVGLSLSLPPRFGSFSHPLFSTDCKPRCFGSSSDSLSNLHSGVAAPAARRPPRFPPRNVRQRIYLVMLSQRPAKSPGFAPLLCSRFVLR